MNTVPLWEMFIHFGLINSSILLYARHLHVQIFIARLLHVMLLPQVDFSILESSGCILYLTHFFIDILGTHYLCKFLSGRWILQGSMKQVKSATYKRLIKVDDQRIETRIEYVPSHWLKQIFQCLIKMQIT